MKFLDLDPIARAAGTVKMPGSKSISNRVLLLAALADGETRVENLLDSDDTGVMLDALELLGVRIERDSASGAAISSAERYCEDTSPRTRTDAPRRIAPGCRASGGKPSLPR